MAYIPKICYNLIIEGVQQMRKRLTRKAKRTKRKIAIIISTLCLLFVMIAGYAAFQTNLNITAKGNIAQKSRVIQSWTSTSNEDFHTDYYRENIISVTFLDDARVPSNAVESWDVSETKDRGVMAYVVQNSEDNTKYDLYIGANGGVIANEDSSYLFYYFANLENINFNESFNTSNTTNMSHMFADSRELITLDLTTLDTRNVTNMAGMFMSSATANPMKLETIILGSNFNTINVTTMAAMFGNCTSLKNLDVSHFNTSNVTNMSEMFASCYSLPFLDLSNWDTSKVTTMHGMFYHCRSLTELNLCTFDTNQVTSMSLMFTGTSDLSNIYVGPNWTTENTTITNMFTYSGVSEVTTGQC